MKGDANFYHDRITSGDKELRKLKKAKNKYMKIVADINREICNMERQIQKDMHCFSITTADCAYSTIVE